MQKFVQGDRICYRRAFMVSVSFPWIGHQTASTFGSIVWQFRWYLYDYKYIEIVDYFVWENVTARSYLLSLSFFFFFLLAWGVWASLHAPRLVPTIHWTSCKSSEQVRHRGGNRRAHRESNSGLERNKSHIMNIFSIYLFRKIIDFFFKWKSQF
jgi:hypothetical protein